MKILKISAKILFFFLLLVSFNTSWARENVTDWYIKSFDSEIIVNKDSSLNITERITADCGDASGKHGIFRILPENVKVGEKRIETPVELLSITDFSGNPLKYSVSKSGTDKTVTWKIGDPQITVQGKNNYEIRYRVKNAIRFQNPNFDELYWNLNGNFWDLEIDSYHAKIIFPEEVTSENSAVEYYSGNLGESGKGLAVHRWSDSNILEFDSAGTLAKKQGITVSVTFPNDIFNPYVPGFWQQYGRYFYLLIPLVIFSVCFYFWWKFGKDPRVKKTVIPEYDVPGHLTPIEAGMLSKNGRFRNELVTAEIVNLAVNNLLEIKEIDKKILIFESRDYEFSKKENSQVLSALNSAQRKIFDKLFEKGNKVKLSSLKNSFYTVLKDIRRQTKKILTKKKLIVRLGLQLQIIFNVIGAIFIGTSFIFGSVTFYLSASFFLSGAIIFLFGFFMPKRTAAGANLNWEIRGFKLFMETVDKHRAQFYEKENIFEKYLPYAIVFGITGIWIKKMKEIYGAEYFTSHAPAWYIGPAAAFNAESFESAIDSLSSSIAANTSSSSGSGGAGSAGGGGGGGGGGGW